MPISTARGTDHQASAAHERRQEVFGHVPVDPRTDRNSEDDVHPDLPHDVADGLVPIPDAIRDRHRLFLGPPVVDSHGLVHPGLHMFLHAEAADRPSCDHRDPKTGAQIKSRDLPPEQAEQEHEGDLVHHRGGNQEGERHPQRDSRGNEPDEHRDRGTGAEGGHDPEKGRENVPRRLPLSRQDPAGPIRRKVGPGDTDPEHHQGQQQEDLRGIEDEKLHRRGEVRPPGQGKDVVSHPPGELCEAPIEKPPPGEQQDAGKEVTPWVRGSDGRRWFRLRDSPTRPRIATRFVFHRIRSVPPKKGFAFTWRPGYNINILLFVNMKEATWD